MVCSSRFSAAGATPGFAFGTVGVSGCGGVTGADEVASGAGVTSERTATARRAHSSVKRWIQSKSACGAPLEGRPARTTCRISALQATKPRQSQIAWTVSSTVRLCSSGDGASFSFCSSCSTRRVMLAHTTCGRPCAERLQPTRCSTVQEALSFRPSKTGTHLARRLWKSSSRMSVHSSRTLSISESASSACILTRLSGDTMGIAMADRANARQNSPLMGAPVVSLSSSRKTTTLLSCTRLCESTLKRRSATFLSRSSHLYETKTWYWSCGPRGLSHCLKSDLISAMVHFMLDDGITNASLRARVSSNFAKGSSSRCSGWSSS
mmetsp:Transcript_46342/g.92932  ORF Transcript_46342/g.92932 Transcript_46342/m.92932 type:complete len:323 (+) Transcript_46342:772-1740(+)